MTSTQQRAELQNQIWKIANEVRGSVDGLDFKLIRSVWKASEHYSDYKEE